MNTRTVLVSWVAILMLSFVSAAIALGAFPFQSSGMSFVELLIEMGVKTYLVLLAGIAVIRGAYTFQSASNE
ncbi:hypothetical protein [Celeribacter litoreus]|uniref:hypothetical protein n=1 Tax=Celeribacter litoreus TaxID=2876714 RepID=UPI001CC9DD4B|nr:hypothetical protein [Celeribacter litoreus]MCA0042581.1 hypothetical protein [Celeribacter litoreus]